MVFLIVACNSTFVGMTSKTCHSCVVSKSLICSENLVLTEDEEKKFCLGLYGWCPCRVCSPRMEKKSLRLKRARELPKEPLVSEVEDSEELSSKLRKVDERFDFNVTIDDLTRFMEGETPANTERSTTWAVKIFDDWRKARNATLPTDLSRKCIYS